MTKKSEKQRKTEAQTQEKQAEHFRDFKEEQ